jgi:hypothetical protein
MSIITTYDLHQKNLDLQILCSKKDIEIYKLKKQINSLINDVVITTDNDDDDEIIDSEVIKLEPLIIVEDTKIKEKTINVKVKECYDCRREDRTSFPTMGYRCKDENCMYFNRT